MEVAACERGRWPNDNGHQEQRACCNRAFHCSSGHLSPVTASYPILNRFPSLSNTGRSPVISRMSKKLRFPSLLRNTLDQRMLFEQGIPNGRKIIPPAHRVSAHARKLVRPLLRHRPHKRPDSGRTFDLDQCNFPPLAGPGYIMDWDDYFRQQAAMYRELAQKTEDTF